MFVAGPVGATTASDLPAIGDTRSSVEAQYGLAYIIQEDSTRFWTDGQWVEQNTKPVPAKAYGYPFSLRGLNATLWIEYDRENRVARESFLLADNLKIRHFGQYFPELYAAITAKDNVAAVIRSYPRDQLAVKINASGGAEEWIRFFFTNDDKTCVNMHSKIKGFEIAEVPIAAIKEQMKPGKALGCQFNGEIGEFPTDGTWQRADNYFLPQLYFSERLIPRQGTDLIVIHHAAMSIDTSRSDIHELHLTNAWAGIGYHKLVFANGTVADGRPESMIGAHAYGANRRSLGIVLVGDFTKVRPAQVQLEEAARVTLDLMQKYRIPMEKVQPHRAVTEGTDCPGQQFPWQEFVRMLENGLKQELGNARL